MGIPNRLRNRKTFTISLEFHRESAVIAELFQDLVEYLVEFDDLGMKWEMMDLCIDIVDDSLDESLFQAWPSEYRIPQESDSSEHEKKRNKDQEKIHTFLQKDLLREFDTFEELIKFFLKHFLLFHKDLRDFLVEFFIGQNNLLRLLIGSMQELANFSIDQMLRLI